MAYSKVLSPKTNAGRITHYEISLNILQINSRDIGGGAEKIALTLHTAYRSANHQAWLLVRWRRGSNESVVALDSHLIRNPYVRFWYRVASFPRSMEGKVRGAHKLGNFFETVGNPNSLIRHWRGIESAGHPASRSLLDHIPVSPDIIHCHNLHGDYFDLSILPELSQTKPVALTLHDTWTFTGHCAYTHKCDRWKSGCGECPYLDTYPAIVRDNTHRNWLKKQEIYKKSCLYIATPSQWLMKMAEQSVLSGGIKNHKVIPNGVDLSIFHPAQKRLPRDCFGIQQDALVILFVAANAKSSRFKDYNMLREALTIVGARNWNKPIIAISLGEASPTLHIGNVELQHIPFNSDPSLVAQYYQAADIYVHPAKEDNFPTTVIEALACGLPVVATSVGGIPEQIEDGKTGYLIPPGDTESMASTIIRLLEDEPLRMAMASAATESATSRFDQKDMARAYLDWYSFILEDRHGRQ